MKVEDIVKVEDKNKSLLYDYQMDAVKKMSNGCILNGGVGSGKSRTTNKPDDADNSIKVEVVDFSEMSVEEASEKLKKKGFKFEIQYEESDTIEEGYVIETKPKAGSSKKKGSIIVILESSGIADVILKDYTNQKVESLEKKLKDLGLDVKVEKKEVENPKDYIGKTGVVIDQSPKYNIEEEVELKAGTEIILYVPDIFEDYPDMIGEGWTVAKVEEFANDYGLVMNVKDKNGNNITDYSNHLNEVVINQNRTGKIASGVAFAVTIDVDMSTYDLIINYIDKDTGKALENSKTEKKNNGESGTVTCPGKAGYVREKDEVPYKIDGSKVTVNCYYTKEVELPSEPVVGENPENNDSNE